MKKIEYPSEEEMFLRERLSVIYEKYAEEVRPIMERLKQLAETRPVSWLVTYEEAEKIGLKLEIVDDHHRD